MGSHNAHSEVLGNQDFELGALRFLPAGQGDHGVAVHQGGNVAAHTVGPGAAVRVDLGGVGDGVAGGAQVGGHGVEGCEVEIGQAGHGAAEVNPFHDESLPGYARAVEWGVMRRGLGVVPRATGRWPVPARPSAAG